MCLPLFVCAEDKTESAMADQCSDTKLAKAVEELRKDDFVTTGYDVLVRCGSKSVPVLIRAIKNQDRNIRARAVGILGIIAPNSAPAIPALINALNDPKNDLQSDIIEALGEIGEGAKAAIPVIVPYLKDKDTSTRTIAATALMKIGYQGREITPILSAALRDKNTSDDLVETLGYIGQNAAPLVPTLVELLKSSSQDSYRITETLGRIGKGAKEAVPVLIVQLKNKDDLLRSMTFETLGEIGEEARAAIPELVAVLQNKKNNGEIRDRASDTLGKMGKDAVLPAIALLHNQDIDVRISAAKALGGIGRDAKAAIPDLLAILTDKKLNAQSRVAKPPRNFERESFSPSTLLLDAATDAFGSIGSDAVPYLVNILRNPNTELRSRAARALIQARKDAVPALIGLIKDKDEEIRFIAYDTLETIGKDAEQAIPALIAIFRENEDRDRTDTSRTLNLLEVATTGGGVEGIRDAKDLDRELGVRYKASRALGAIGTPAIPALVLALKDVDVNVRLGAIASLEVNRDKSSESSEVISALTDALSDRDSYARIRAAFVVGRTAKDKNAAISTLIVALNHKDPFIRSIAVQYLVVIRKDASPALISAFKDRSNPARELALVALGQIPSDTKGVIPILFEALKEEGNIRFSAAFSIAQIHQISRAIPENSIPENMKNDWSGVVTPENTRELVNILIAALQDKDIVRRFQAAYALSQMGKEARAAIPALIVALKDPGIGVRGHAAAALGAIGEDAKEAVPILINQLKAQDTSLHYSAASALGGIGKAAKDATPILIEIIRNEKEELFVRHVAIESLKKIGTEEAISALSSYKDTINKINEKMNARLNQSTIEVMKPINH